MPSPICTRGALTSCVKDRLEWGRSGRLLVASRTAGMRRKPDVEGGQGEPLAGWATAVSGRRAGGVRRAQLSVPSVDAPLQARENVGIVVARGRMLSSVRRAALGFRGTDAPGPRSGRSLRQQTSGERANRRPGYYLGVPLACEQRHDRRDYRPTASAGSFRRDAHRARSDECGRPARHGATLGSAGCTAFRDPSRLHRDNRRAGVAGAAALVSARPGDAAPRHDAGDNVRADARMHPPHRLRLAPPQRCSGLDRWRAELLQLDLLSLFPRLASSLHPGPGARPRADVPARQQPIVLSARDQHDRVLVSPRGRLRKARARHGAAAFYAGQRAPHGSALDCDPVAPSISPRRPRSRWDSPRRSISSSCRQSWRCR